MTDLNSQNSINFRNLEEVSTSPSAEVNALLQFYPEEAKEKLMKNKEKITNVAKSFANLSIDGVTVATTVMRCDPEKCPHRSVCILAKNEIAPNGYPCPIETKVFHQLKTDLMSTLEIDPINAIEMELLNNLIDMKLLDLRASSAMNNGEVITLASSTMKNEKAGIENTSTRFELHPAFILKQEVYEIKMDIMESFIGTRRAKKKFGVLDKKLSMEEVLMNSIKAKKETESAKDT